MENSFPSHEIHATELGGMISPKTRSQSYQTVKQRSLTYTVFLVQAASPHRGEAVDTPPPAVVECSEGCWAGKGVLSLTSWEPLANYSPPPRSFRSLFVQRGEWKRLVIDRSTGSSKPFLRYSHMINVLTKINCAYSTCQAPRALPWRL